MSNPKFPPLPDWIMDDAYRAALAQDEGYDNDLARVIDAEPADRMEEAGYDIRFVTPFHPAYRQRSTGIWSVNEFNGGMPLSTPLAETWADIVAEVYEAKLALFAQDVSGYLPAYQERRHALEGRAGLDCGCASPEELAERVRRHERQFAASRKFRADRLAGR